MSWNSVTHAIRYELRESDDGGKVWDDDYTLRNGTRRAFSGQDPGNWTYQVRACNNDASPACSDWSASITVSVPRLAAPASLASTAPTAGGDYTVSWNTVTHAVRYELRESDDDGKTWDATYSTSSSTRRAFTGKTSGAWTYQVRACRYRSTSCGNWSASYTVTISAIPVAANLAATTPDANGDYAVSWDAVTGAARYQLQESDDDGVSWDTTYTITTGVTKSITGKTVGAWSYRVRACRQDNVTCGNWSATLSVAVPGPPARPDAPDLTSGDDQLTVTWIAPADNGSALTGYNVRYRLATATNWSAHSHTTTATETVIDNLTNGLEYVVQVQAVNARGNSPWSERATATPQRQLAAPSGLTAPASSSGDHSVSWQPVTGATRYELQARRDGANWMTHDTGSQTSKAFSALTNGAWDYRARACDGQYCGPWSALVTVTVGTSPVPRPPAPARTPPNAVINDTEKSKIDRAGTLPGSFRADESGAATYRIEIPLPPGTARVVPPLALSYNSQRGNGPVGIGWGIEGLSAITRCRQTLAQDGAAQPLTFTRNDRFCLDGQRLTLSDSAANKNRKYGEANTEYKTEIDSFSTVTVKHDTDGHPDYFEVTRKDGSVATYGASGAHASEHKLYARLTDSSPTDPALTWALQQVKDSVGNKITYHYTLDAKGHRLREIRYAYGDPGKTTQSARAKVVFGYDLTRGDITRGYLAGHPLQSAQRLTTITVHSAGTTGSVTALRNYRLRYQSATTHALSRLAGVKACVGSGTTVCQPETTFAWSDPAPLFKQAAAATLTLNTESKWSPVDFNPADINGDGLTDLVWTEASSDKHRLRYALTDKTTGRLVSGVFVGGGTSLEYDDGYGTSNYGENLRVHTEVVDYNGDGRHDLLVYSAKTNETRLHLAVPQTTSGTQATGGWRLSAGATVSDRLFDGRYRYADLNSDGLLDAYRLVELSHPAPQQGQPTRYAPAGYKLAVRYLKRNTAAKPDSSRYYAYTGETQLPIGFTPQAATATGLELLRWRSLEVADVALADMDGDGRADLITWGYDSAIQLGLQRGSNAGQVTHALRRLHVFRQTDGENSIEFKPYSAAAGLPLAATGLSPKGLRSTDLNGDGLSDLLYFVGKWYRKSKDNYQWTGNWHYRLSTGAGFTDATQLTNVATGAQAPSALSLYDDNGDGYPDALYHDVKGKALRVQRFSPKTGAYAAALSVRTTRGKDAEQYFTADVNGDGNADLLHLPESGTSTESLATYHHNTATRPHLITAITNGLGAKTVLTYESLSRSDAYARIDGLHTTRTQQQRCFTWGGARFCWKAQTASLNASDFYTALNTSWADSTLTDSLSALAGNAPVLELMAPLYVLTRVDSSAPTSANAAALSSVCYLYEQAKIQAGGRGLLGFKTLTTMDLQTEVATTTTYRQDFPYTGYPLKTEVKTEDGHLLRAATNTWRLKGYQSGWNVAQPTTDLGALQPYLAQAVETTYDLPVTETSNNVTTTKAGAKITTVTTNTEVDSYGNPDTITTTTEDHANAKRFRQMTANTYGTATDTESKELGRLTKSVVTRKRNETANSDSYDSKITASRTAEFSYYTSGHRKGLLKTEVREPNKAGLKHTTTYDYDKFGHRIRAAVTAGGVTRCNTDTTAYDSAGRFVTVEKDCLGRPLHRVRAYNAHGLPTQSEQVLDVDSSYAVTASLKTTYHYTAGGRLYFTHSADGSYTGTLRAACAGVSHCPGQAAWYTETRLAGGGVNRDYRDILGRGVRTAQRGFDGRWVHSDTDYDALGRVARQSEPYYAGSTVYRTVHAYDLLGRVTQTTLPDYSARRNSRLTLTYQGLSAKTVNGKGQASTETRNALGEVIKTTDAAGTPVMHRYDAWGQVVATVTGTGDAAVTVAWAYDLRGRRVKETDPNRGVTRYAYNGFDELVQQTDAVGNVQALTYDALGRPLTRRDTVPDGADADTKPDIESEVTWTYDTAANGFGQLSRVTDTRSGYVRAHRYDTLGRSGVTETTVRVGTAAKTYYSRRTFDEYGRPYQTFDAARQQADWTDNVVAVQYNQWGHAYRWADGVREHNRPRAVYRTITGQDARGQVTRETLGGGALSTTRTIEASTGRVELFNTRNALHATLQQHSYRWDVLGNLTGRGWQGGRGWISELLSYDRHNRLVRAWSVGAGVNVNRTVHYDAHGNITRKSDVGDYTYGSTAPSAPGPHAVVQAGADTYTYDAHGNQRSGAGRTLTYTAFNKVAGITRGTHATTFVYDPDRRRSARTDTVRTGQGTSTTTTVYLGAVEHIIAADGASTYRRTLAGGTVLITQQHNKAGARTANDTRYLLRDHLDSVVALFDSAGAIVQHLRYDPWGQRIDPDNSELLAQLSLTSALHTRFTARGYTDHEMLDAYGLIHMNGRIYDPKLGRFLQADPVIQFPHSTQGQNRYSYVLNNPLTYTDPSGYFIGKLFKGVFKSLNKVFGDSAPLLSIALLAIPGVQAWVFQSWLNAFQFGFVTGGIATGSVKGALFGGISAAAFYGIGAHFTALTGLPAGGAGHVLTHGLAGGVLAELQGGQFGNGFLAAGLSKAVMGQLRYTDPSAPAVIGRTTIAAVVGGTISRITGGKFANGALTAAMAQLFNNEAANIAKANRQKQLAHLIVRPTEDSILYEYGDASVLVQNDVPGNGIPQVSIKQIGQMLDLSNQEGGRTVNIISGYRGPNHVNTSINHEKYGALDVYINNYNSTQTAKALYKTGYFHRVAGYPRSNLQSVHGDNRTTQKGGCFVEWGGASC